MTERARTTTTAPAQDRDSAPWWDALTRHELLLQRCDGCAAFRWPPRDLCGRCASFDWSWVPAEGTGTVASWNVTWRTAGTDTPVPYVVLLVRLDDQPDILMPGSYEGPSDGHDLEVGLPLGVGFVDLDDGGERFSLPTWHRAGEGTHI